VTRALFELTKPRIVALVLVTVGAAFQLGSTGPVSLLLLGHVLLGTALVAGGTNALNQVFEADVDRRMQRTKGRPLPTGRLLPGPAATFAWGLGVTGVAYLALTVGWLVAGIALLTLMSYVFVYTPLKRRTTLSTLIGAVPGALPVLGGWVAARGRAGPEAVVLFGILFLWQLPHFLALAWIYREDYRAAGLRIVSVDDPDGRRTFRQASWASLALVSAALAPTLSGVAGVTYFWAALLLSSWLLWAALTAAMRPSTQRARRLFGTSVAYLPLLFTIMMLDKVR
jgi:protoheme IX farnesyltransferase